MARMFENIMKRDRDTIIRHIKNLEEKYGENTVKLVVNRFYKVKKEKNWATKRKQELEDELKILDKKI